MSGNISGSSAKFNNSIKVKHDLNNHYPGYDYTRSLNM